VSCLNADEFLCAVCVTTGKNPSAFAGYLNGKESRFKNLRFLGIFVVFNQLKGQGEVLVNTTFNAGE